MSNPWAMEKRYKDYQPNQMLLLPPSLEDWLPQKHLARFISDVVDEMDLTPITRVYEKELRGQPPFHPRMMVKVLFYGWATGVLSSRKLAQHLYEDVAFRYLSGNTQPDFRTLSSFRQRHREARGQLFEQLVRVAVQSGLAPLFHVCVDGTKIQAHASKHKAMTYGRMQETEKRLQAEIQALLQRAEKLDEQEDQRYGAANADDLPAELAFREKRLAKIRAAMAALEAEAAAREASSQKADSSKGRTPPPSGEATRSGPAPTRPDPQSQRNFTDPDSRIMLSKDKAFIQAYNAQLAVDRDHPIIVGTAVTNQANDHGMLTTLVNRVTEITGLHPDAVSADAGYFEQNELLELEKKRIQLFVPPSRGKHGETLEPAPKGRIPDDLPYIERMRRRLRTQYGRQQYAHRMKTVEPVMGQIKRALGFTQFSLRGLGKVQGEWTFMAIGHNLRKLWAFADLVLKTLRKMTAERVGA